MRRTNKKLKQKNNRTRKNYFIGGTMTEEELKYYGDFMAIKSDATAILHESREVREICVDMCKQLTHDICMTENDVFNYIKNEVVPRMFSTSLQDGTLNMTKIEKFIRNEFDNNEEQYKSSLDAFINIHSHGYTPNENDILNYSFIFYRFYLKGGSAFVLMVQLYNNLISTDEELKKINKTISEDEMIKILGKSSDYDFNFLINRHISKPHFDILTLKSSVLIANLLKGLIYKFSEKMFNNDAIITNFKALLLRNSMRLEADDRPLTQILKVKKTFHDYASKFYFNELITERNDATNNKLGHVSISALDIDNKAYKGEGRKNANFILVRLMTFFINKLNREITRDEKQFSEICGELIDVSIPLYDGYEKNVKWIEESNTLILINGIYCYNLNVMVKDLNRMIFEDTKNGMKTKIEKRKKRLLFFNNLICILPKLLFPSEELYKHTGLYDTHGNCKNVLNFLFGKEDFVDKRPKLMNDLKNIMEGIYLNFPDTINNENLNMYVLLKQYFYYYLIISVQKSTYYLKSYFTENQQFSSFVENTSFTNRYIYENPNENYFNCLIKNGSSYYCLDNINNNIYGIIFECVDELKRNDVSENILSTCIKLFNSIIYSITDNSMLQFEALINFIRFLMFMNETGYPIPNQHLINFRQYIINSTSIYNYVLSTIINGNMLKKHIIFYTLKFVNNPNHQNSIKLYLHGNYAYQLHYMMIYFFYNDVYNPEVLDINNFLNHNDFILDDFSLKVILPNTIDDEIFKTNVDLIYEYYKSECFHLFNEKSVFNSSSYPCKIYVNLIKDEKSYKITGKIDVIYPVNGDIINSEFNYMMELINGSLFQEKYRILSYTFFNIEIEMENDEVNKLKINDIIDDVNYFNKENYKEIFFNNYQEFVRENIYDNVLIEPLEDIIYNYNQIINDVELDVIAKHKYIHKLLNLGVRN
jgi:hypothetical protein